jgi:RNase H-like domain found in reverse transcriptase/Integrase zinc binding domain
MASNIYVTTNASDCPTGTVLSFGAAWETAQLVAYNSYQLNDAEKNYPVHEKELLAIIKAFEKWRSHLLGTHFKVFTDHQTLKYFQSQKEVSRQQMRWSIYMANFDYNITYIHGEENTAADTLFCMPDAPPDACLTACAITYTCKALTTHTAGILNIATDQSLLNAIITGYETDSFAKQLMKDIDMGSIKGATLTNKLLYVSCQLVIPQDLKVCELLYNLAHNTLNHFGFDKSYKSLCGSYYWPNMHWDLENAYIPSCTEC